MGVQAIITYKLFLGMGGGAGNVQHSKAKQNHLNQSSLKSALCVCLSCGTEFPGSH